METATVQERCLSINDRQQSAVPLIYTLFFLSGFAALVYEAAWSRQIGLAIGQTAQAAALVLAAYFSGMAIGQFVGGRLTKRVSPLLGYGVAELIASAWGCIIPAMLDWVGSTAGPGDWSLFRESSVGRAVWCFLILLPATIPLGATLPLMIEALALETGSRRRGITAYALNTAGGFVGIVAAAVLLLVAVGVRGSGYFAAVMSAVCGLIACMAVMLGRDRTSLPVENTVAEQSPDGDWFWPIFAAISGFGTLGLEVLYTRLFTLIFHNSTYTFAAIIAVFLLALALGAVLASLAGKWYSTRQIAAVSLSLGGLVLAISITAFPWVTGFEYFSYGDTFAGYIGGAFELVALFVLPPVTLLGMSLPIAIGAATSSRAVGTLTAANTLAGAAGAIAAGFFLPQMIGLWLSFAVFAVLFGAAGVVLFCISGHQKTAIILGLLSAGTIVMLVGGPVLDHRAVGNRELVRRWESDYGWVDVARDRNGALSIWQNLHYRHGSTANATRQYRQGQIPLLLHKQPAEVAFLGLGTGMTAAPAIVDECVESVEVIELIPEVVSAARFLKETNLGVVDHPKVTVHTADARHYLLRTERRFDLIVSDLFVPWESRTGYLYTVEFYETVQRRMKPGGLFCQWIALYQLGPEQFEMIADSFSSVFPHTTIWWGRFDGKFAIVAIVGSEQPIEIDAQQLELRLAAWNRQAIGKDSELQSTTDLAELFLGSWPRNPARKLNTDEHPWLEFTAPISHRTGRTLSGLVLRYYFDQKLVLLPSTGARFPGGSNTLIDDAKRRHANQRSVLFGDLEHF
jgi:spermidine synthase